MLKIGDIEKFLQVISKKGGENMQFKAGDIVSINTNATIQDIFDCGYQCTVKDTLSLLWRLKDNAIDIKNVEFEVKRVEPTGNITLEGECTKFNDFYANAVFKLMKRPIRKMTVKEVCEELGYDIEIIKGD